VISLRGWPDSSGAVPWLLNALNDQDAHVRQFAAENFGRIRDRRAVEPLIKALADADAHVRASSASALGKQGDARAVPALVKVIQDASEGRLARCSAGVSLGLIGGSTAVDTLIATIDDRNAPQLVRQGATSGLMMCPAQRVKDRAAAVLSDTQEDVDIRAVVVMVGGKELNKQRAALLSKVAKDKASGERIQFWAALRLAELADGAIDDPEIVAPLAGYRNSHETIGQVAEQLEAGKKALEAIADRGKTEAVRRAAQELMQRLGYVAASPPPTPDATAPSTPTP
jgi:HEAT repeat protein